MFQWNPSQMRQQAVYNNNNYFEDCNDPIPLEIERLHNVARFQMNVLRLIKNKKLYIKTQFSWYLKTWCMILSNSNIKLQRWENKVSLFCKFCKNFHSQISWKGDAFTEDNYYLTFIRINYDYCVNKIVGSVRSLRNTK